MSPRTPAHAAPALAPCVSSGRGRINYEDMSPAELAELREAAQRYLAGQADEAALPADTIKHIREVRRRGGLV